MIEANARANVEIKSIPKPDYEVVYLPPEARSAPGEYRVIRKANERKTFGSRSGIAPGTDFNPFVI